MDWIVISKSAFARAARFAESALRSVKQLQSPCLGGRILDPFEKAPSSSIGALHCTEFTCIGVRFLWPGPGYRVESATSALLARFGHMRIEISRIRAVEVDLPGYQNY
jgi:hypothetical protein